MIDNYAALFMRVASAIQFLLNYEEMVNGMDDPVTAEEVKNEMPHVDEVVSACRDFGLVQSFRIADELRRSWNPEGINRMMQERTFLHLRKTIENEAGSVWKMRLGPQDADLFRTIQPFGLDVANKFPSVGPDIEEAAKCLAVGRYTASVFHAMRALEYGVQQFGLKLGYASAPDKEWQKILNQADSAITALPQSTPAEKKLKEEFAEVAGYLHHIKMSCRNDVMHPGSAYTEVQARDLYRDTKRFMTRLAQIL